MDFNTVAEVKTERFVKILNAALVHAADDDLGLEPIACVYLDVKDDTMLVWASDRFTVVTLALGAQNTQAGWNATIPRRVIEDIIAGFKRVGKASTTVIGYAADGSQIKFTASGSSASFVHDVEEAQFPHAIRGLYKNPEILLPAPEAATVVSYDQLEKFRKTRLHSTDQMFVKFHPAGAHKPLQVTIGNYCAGMIMPHRSDGTNMVTRELGISD